MCSHLPSLGLTISLTCFAAFAEEPPAAEKTTASSRTFYVDSDKGSDRYDGRDPETAWSSLARVNAAELQPGDIVRFKCGGCWRGSLRPASGQPGRPVTYTWYGQGPKPMLLGSVPRRRPEDWMQVGDRLWATLPMEYRLDQQLADLGGSSWWHHQEAGANVQLVPVDAPAGKIVELRCKASGSAGNHIQLWGPGVPVRRGAHLVMTFRARCSKPFRPGTMSLRKGGSPWTSYGEARTLDRAIDSQWHSYQAVFSVRETAEDAHLHVNLGGSLPADSVFEFQPQSLHLATPSLTDPPAVDVGNIIFDAGKVCGWKKWSVDDLEQLYDFYYEPSTWRVYLCCEANPATLHDSIELALKRHVVDQSGVHHVVYDGLAIRYGAAHGFGGGSTHDLVIRNCDLCYIGGGHQHSRPDGIPVRYGNAIEFWGAAHDNLVEGCRIWQIYDAALTNQNNAAGIHQDNITYRNNIVWDSEYSFEYWNRPETSMTRNIRFIHNLCFNAGFGWAHEQRPDPNGSHLMFYTNTADTAGFEVKYNVFCNFTEWGSRYSAGWRSLPEMDYNVWYSDQGVMANWFGQRIADFATYQTITGLDAHSLFADPKFLDPGSGDFRLAPDSPARQIIPQMP